jgi:hypothetical protein
MVFLSTNLFAEYLVYVFHHNLPIQVFKPFTNKELKANKSLKLTKFSDPSSPGQSLNPVEDINQITVIGTLSTP